MKRWTKSIIGFILGLLGFSSCDPLGFLFPKMYGPAAAEYGAPHATYRFKAEATDQEGNPLEGIRVAVVPQGQVDDWQNDTLYTGKDGKAELDMLKYSWPSQDNMKVVFDDVDGADGGGSFDSVTLDKNSLDIEKTAEGSGNWDQGDFTITAKAQLPKK